MGVARGLQDRYGTPGFLCGGAAAAAGRRAVLAAVLLLSLAHMLIRLSWVFRSS